MKNKLEKIYIFFEIEKKKTRKTSSNRKNKINQKNIYFF